MIRRGDAGGRVATVDLGHGEIQREQHSRTRLGLFSMASLCRSIRPGISVWPRSDLAGGPRAGRFDGGDAAVLDQHGAVFQHAVFQHHAGMGEIGALHHCSSSSSAARLAADAGFRASVRVATASRTRHRERSPAGSGLGQRLADQRDHHVAIIRVQRRGRFIQQQDGMAGDEAARDVHALLFPAREGGRGQAPQAPRHVQPRQHGAGALARLVRVHAGLPQRLGHHVQRRDARDRAGTG